MNGYHVLKTHVYVLSVIVYDGIKIRGKEMKSVNIEITGIAPLLHHRFQTENHGENASKSKKKVYDPKEEAENCLYRNSAGEIYQPAEHIFQAMVKGAVAYKFEGKKTYKDVITSGIAISPEDIPLITEQDYEIDARPVVIQRSRVVRWRPRFNEWKVRFTIDILDDENISVPILKDILETAGKTKGIGDYRPRFGRFMVSKFEEVDSH